MKLFVCRGFRRTPSWALDWGEMLWLTLSQQEVMAQVPQSMQAYRKFVELSKLCEKHKVRCRLGSMHACAIAVVQWNSVLGASTTASSGLCSRFVPLGLFRSASFLHGSHIVPRSRSTVSGDLDAMDTLAYNCSIS